MKSDGHRKYAVIHWERFLSEYLASRRENRHVFEMIRDSFPCRLFFDLEFSIKSNPGVNGNDLTSKWIYLVAWKVYQLWGVSLDKGHFVVFDSTQPNIKFSKHITVIIPSPKQSSTREYSQHPQGDAIFELLSRECVCSNPYC